MSTPTTLGQVPKPVTAHIASFLEDDTLDILKQTSRRCREAAQIEVEKTFPASVFDQIKAHHATTPSILHTVDLTGSPTNFQKAVKVREIFRRVWGITHQRTPVTIADYHIGTEQGESIRRDTFTVWEAIVEQINEMPGVDHIELLHEAMEVLYDANPKEALGNWIDALPEAARNLTALALPYRGLSFLPPEISKFTQLLHLDINGNQFTELPEVIGSLVHLRTLNLSANELTELPEVIGNLVHLQILYLQNNQLTELPGTIGNLSQLQKLHLNQNLLNDLPNTIGHLSQLWDLYLEGNQLAELPDTIVNLSQLKKLSLNGNQLIALPATIGGLGQLEELWLDVNQLTELPATIVNCSRLETLWLRGNQITELPLTIGNLDRLVMLHLDENPLTELPATIENLVRLDLLFLGGEVLNRADLIRNVAALSEGQRNRLRLHILALAHPDDDTDPEWGRHHMYDLQDNDLLCLEQAYNLVVGE